MKTIRASDQQMPSPGGEAFSASEPAISRRTFIRTFAGTALAGAIGSTILAACGGTAAPASNAAAGKPSSAAPASSAAAPASSAAAPPSSAASPASSAAASKPSGALRKVTLSYAAPSAVQALLWIAQDAGLLKKYGLDANIQFVSSPQQQAAVIGHRIDAALGGPTTVLLADLEGGNLEIIANLLTTAQANLWGQPSIKSAQDLKGKVVGGAGVESNPMTDQAKFSLTKMGLDPAKDVKWQMFGNTTELTNALLSGAIDACALNPPDDLRAQKAGKVLVHDLRKDQYPYPGLCLYSRKDEDPQIKLPVLKATLEAIKVYKTNPGESASIIMKWTKNNDKEVANHAVQYFSGAIPRVPKIASADIANALQVLSSTRSDAAKADPTRFYDNSYLDQLESQGFVKTLWGE